MMGGVGGFQGLEEGLEEMGEIWQFRKEVWGVFKGQEESRGVFKGWEEGWGD